MADPAYRALAEAALAVAKRRAELLDRIRSALLGKDDFRALRLMRIYAGIDEAKHGEEEDDRVDSGLH